MGLRMNIRTVTLSNLPAPEFTPLQQAIFLRAKRGLGCKLVHGIQSLAYIVYLDYRLDTIFGTWFSQEAICQKTDFLFSLGYFLS